MRERHPIGEINGGWSILLKLALLLVVPGIGSQIWMAKSVWVLDANIQHLRQIVEELHESHSILDGRIDKMERDVHKHTTMP